MRACLFRNICLAILVVVLFGTAEHAIAQVNFDGDTIVKRAKTSGICHPPGTAFFDRTKNFETMKLSECLDEGGRLPRIYEEYWAAKQQSVDQSLRCQDEDRLKPECQPVVQAQTKSREAEADQKKFANFKFGIALSALFYDEPRIDDIRIVDGTVIVGAKRDTVAAVLVESHYFVTFERTGPNFGVGPFLSASLTDEQGTNPLSIFGAGLMVGWKREDSSGSWNVGAGYFVDTEALELREGLADGQMTDITDSANLTQTVDQEGWFILFSATW